MLRFTAVACLAMTVLAAWFSAGQSLEKPSKQQPPLESRSDNASLHFEFAELEAGSGILNLPAGIDSYLVVRSNDPEASTARLTLSRQPRDRSVTHSWEDASASIGLNPRLECEWVSRIPLRIDDRESGRTKLGIVADTKPKPFYLHVTEGPLDDPRHYATVRSRVIGESEHVLILLDEQVPYGERIETLARRILNEFEQTILPACTPAFGAWRDVDGNGKLTILLSPWLEKLQGGNASLNGFVRGTDFDPRIPAPLGNRCDMIYLNSNLSSAADLRSLLGHEYFHVLQCGLRGNQPGRLPLEEDWLSEAQAHLAEQWLRGDDSNLKHRIASFLEFPGSAPLVVKDYYRAGLWRDDGCRGATYLFLRWCADRAGPDFLGSLLRSPRTGTRGLETIMETPFADLHREWTISLLGEAIGPAENGSRPSEAVGLAHGSIPWEKLEVIPLPESIEDIRISLAPSAVRYFKLPAASRKTCLRIAADSDAALQLTLIDASQLERFQSRRSAARRERVAAGTNHSIDPVR